MSMAIRATRGLISSFSLANDVLNRSRHLSSRSISKKSVASLSSGSLLRNQRFALDNINLAAHHSHSQKRMFSNEGEKSQEHTEKKVDENSDAGNAELEEAKKKVTELEEKVAKITDQLYREAADAANAQQGFKRDIEATKNFGIQKFAKGLLDVADNLQRAIESVKQEELTNQETSLQNLNTLFEGLIMTQTGLKKVLAANGVTEFGATGDEFNPHLHEAMFNSPDEKLPNNTVKQVLKAGYKLNDRVLRPAQVGTVKNP